MSSPLLEYETEMFVSVFSTDGLLVTAEGLGIDRILLHFMRVYSEGVFRGGQSSALIKHDHS